MGRTRGTNGPVATRVACSGSAGRCACRRSRARSSCGCRRRWRQYRQLRRRRRNHDWWISWRARRRPVVLPQVRPWPLAQAVRVGDLLSLRLPQRQRSVAELSVEARLHPGPSLRACFHGCGQSYSTGGLNQADRSGLARDSDRARRPGRSSCRHAPLLWDPRCRGKLHKSPRICCATTTLLVQRAVGSEERRHYARAFSASR